MIYTCIGNHYHAHIHSYPFTNKNTHIPLPIHTHAYAFTSVDSLLLSCVHPGATSTHICSHVLTHILQRAHLNTAKCHTARRCLFIMKRAVGHIVGTSFFHVNIVRKHLFYPSGIQYSLNRILFYHIMNRYNLQMYSKSVNDQVYYLVGIKKAPNCLDAF